MRRLQAALVRWFCRRVGSAKPERLERTMRAPRRRRALLGLIFAAMPRAVRRRALERERVVIEWRLTGRNDGRHDVRQFAIEGGAASVAAGEKHEPDLTVTMDAVTFLLLATGNASGSKAFVKGDVEIDGDPFLAMRIPSLFGSA